MDATLGKLQLLVGAVTLTAWGVWLLQVGIAWMATPHLGAL